jgi:activator of HSP90 ATPase
VSDTRADDWKIQPTRRLALMGAGTLFGALAATARAADAPAKMAKVPAKSANFARTHLHQDAEFAVPPARVYGALLSSEQFTAFSGLPAKIDARPGGTFSLFGGQVVGRNIDLVPNRQIVQAWRAVGDWPPGTYSLVRFDLKPKGAGTAVALEHWGFQEGDFDHLNAGWPPHYWDLMKAYFAKG